MDTGPVRTQPEVGPDGYGHPTASSEIPVRGLTQRTERAWGLAPASRVQRLRHMPPRVALYRRMRYTLLCRPVLVVHLSCLQRTPAPLRRCCIHARCACDRHRYGRSALSGPGGWRLPLEVGDIATYYLAPRLTVARALPCRTVPYWRCSCRASSAHSRRSS